MNKFVLQKQNIKQKLKRALKKITRQSGNDLVAICNHKVDRFIIDGLKNVGFKISKDDLIVESPQNLKFWIDFQHFVLYETFTNKDYEFFTDESDSIFIDIGMNAGFVSLKFAQKESIKKVYSFEPFLQTYNGALKNIALNPSLTSKIKAFPFGLGNKNEKMEVLYQKELAGNMSTVKNLYDGSASPVFKAENAQKEAVEIKDASEVLKEIFEENLDKKIILKCDTEGSEFEIIESLDKSGLLKKIDIILMEYHFKSPKIIEEALIKNHFVVFYKDGYSEKIPVSMLYAVNNSREK